MKTTPTVLRTPVQSAHHDGIHHCASRQIVQESARAVRVLSHLQTAPQPSRRGKARLIHFADSVVRYLKHESLGPVYPAVLQRQEPLLINTSGRLSQALPVVPTRGGRANLHVSPLYHSSTTYCFVSRCTVSIPEITLALRHIHQYRSRYDMATMKFHVQRATETCCSIIMSNQYYYKHLFD